MTLSTYIPLCDALVRLMDPLIEVVIHDIATDRIVYINGSLSARKMGDPALLSKEDLTDVEQVVYPKLNFDGKLVKSISVVLEDKWLLCINCDVSLFAKIQALSEVLVQKGSAAQPQSLFVNDWRERLHHSIHLYLQSQNLSFDLLKSTHKRDLVKHLFALGAFQEKNAADYVAKVLNLGRATVFNYLKEMRKK